MKKREAEAGEDGFSQVQVKGFSEPLAASGANQLHPRKTTERLDKLFFLDVIIELDSRFEEA
jgi:hypothetical protein